MNTDKGALLNYLQAQRVFEGPGKKFFLDSGAQVSDLCMYNVWRQE